MEKVGGRRELISAMMVKCGFNPESLIRKVEEGLEKRINYELGGISIFMQGEYILAEVNHPRISDKLVLYKWKW